MEAIHVVVIIVIAAFSWKLFSILRQEEISKGGKRMAISLYVFTLISLAVALYFG
ncbi:MAG: hypothetical protein KKF57_07415 [Firmicutes bacterium]|nr:hypothetical protein [Bacillota bacterium]